MRRAVLTGTLTRPQVLLHFDYDAGLVESVKSLPGRFWDGDRKCWVVEGFGPSPDRWLRRHGFRLERDMTSQAGPYDLDQLITPMARLTDDRKVEVRHRLAGFDHVAELMPGGQWDSERRLMVADVEEFREADGSVMGGFIINRPLADALAGIDRPLEPPDPVLTALMACDGRDESLVAPIVRKVGDVPEWFGMDPYPYQRAGALALAAGVSFCADDMGLGKTMQALAGAAVIGARRMLVLCPSSAITSWKREAERTRLPEHMGSGGEAVAVTGPPSRERLPEGDGVLVIGVDMLARREGLTDRVNSWAPDLMVVDEAHMLMNLTSTRSKAARWVARRVRARGGRCWALTGTPLMATPYQLAAQLEMTGDIQRYFGGYGGFVRRYTTRTPFGRREARVRRLPELAERLRHVWVRRLKEDVLVDEAGNPLLPPVSLSGDVVDVPLTEYRRAHREVDDLIDEMLVDLGSPPSDDVVDDLAGSNLAVATRLRAAAGLSKVETATGRIRDHLTSHPSQAGGTWPRPLIAWVRHRDVGRALVEALEDVPGVEVYNGATSHAERTRIVDAFQDGRVSVLVAGINAANAAITLTRGSDHLFVEQEWTPAVIAQAICRCWRIGQTRPVQSTIMVAVGTVDEHISMTLSRKGRILDALTPSPQNSVGVVADGEGLEMHQLVVDLITARVPKVFRKDGQVRAQALEKVGRLRAEREEASRG